MANQPPSNDVIPSRAAYWSARLNDNDLNDAEREELQAWLVEDQRHASEFRAHNALLALARDLPPDLRDGLYRFLPAVQEQPQALHRRWMWPAALAAAILVAVVSVGWFRLHPAQHAQNAQVYTTRTGQNLTITLEDGSVAHLNTRTRIEWVAAKNERRVRLLGSGEAFFDVVHDPLRPFIVELEDSEIVVLGTQFNVYRKDSGEVTVTVTQGKVAVREYGDKTPPPRVVSATSSVSYRVPSEIRDAPSTAIESATKWREGLLEVEDQPLPALIDELRRYTDKPIQVDSERLKDRLQGVYTGGRFSVRDIHHTLDRFAQLARAKLVETNGAFTLVDSNE